MKKILRRAKQKALQHKVYNLFSFFYIRKINRLIKMNEINKAVLHLKKGLNIFPYNKRLNKELAKIEMKRENWKSAEEYWQTGFKGKNEKHRVGDYLKYAQVLQINKQYKKAIYLLEKAYVIYSDNENVLYELIELLVETNHAKKFKKYYYQYKKLKSKFTIEEHILLFNFCKSMGLYKEADQILREGLIVFPSSRDLINKQIDLSISFQNWKQAINKLKGYSKRILSFEQLFKLGMLYQISGEANKANQIYKEILSKYDKQVNKDKMGYRKIIVFDNGESRIEFYKQLKVNDAVMITFDAINMQWSKPSFAFKLLMKNNLDIIAVRKRKPKTYQQDLTQEDFIEAVKPIINNYQDKMAYGFSLGAYNALYFASLLGCRILALSPRLSIHPKYGKIKIIPKFNMKHNLNQPFNETISPIIIFDPINKMDYKYVNEHLIHRFPKTRLVKIPYGGHGMGPHLLKMGLLKTFVYNFINGKVPKYDRKRKSKSFIYCRNLGRTCLRHNKINWAFYLAKKAIELNAEDKLAIKLMIDVYKKKDQPDQAIKFAKKSVRNVPNNIDVSIYLINLYVENKKYDDAQLEIHNAIKIHGKHKKLITCKKKIVERR